ncbi:MAG: hypothetical protein P8X82_19520, partial [Gemmatimonadales bacterium]
ILPKLTKAEMSQGATDWNDVHKSRGLAEVGRIVNAAIEYHRQLRPDGLKHENQRQVERKCSP